MYQILSLIEQWDDSVNAPVLTFYMERETFSVASLSWLRTLCLQHLRRRRHLMSLTVALWRWNAHYLLLHYQLFIYCHNSNLGWFFLQRKSMSKYIFPYTASNGPIKSYVHDDVIKWKHFPRHWPFVRGIHRSWSIPRTMASDAELWCFLWSAPE